MKKPPLEKNLVNKVLKMINSRGGAAWKIWGSPNQEKGIPDVMCCYRGRFVAFETKRLEGDEPTPYQQYQIKRIIRAGGVALTIRTVQEAEAILDRIDEDPPLKAPTI